MAAVDRVIRRALAKRPAERPASADAMAEELRAVRGVDGDDTPALARALTRLVVLPFRVLRPDPETDFLAFSLPDAIATSLSGIGSLVVRSSATAARFAGEAPDLKALAAEADVDRVVMGTLLRAGDQLRATAQLVEAPGRARCSRRTRCSRRWAICSGCRTTSPGAWSRRSRCRWRPRRRRPRPTRRTTRAPTSCTCAPTSWRGATTSCRRRATCTSAAWSWIRASRRPGRSSAAATG